MEKENRTRIYTVSPLLSLRVCACVCVVMNYRLEKLNGIKLISSSYLGTRLRQFLQSEAEICKAIQFVNLVKWV